MIKLTCSRAHLNPGREIGVRHQQWLSVLMIMCFFILLQYLIKNYVTCLATRFSRTCKFALKTHKLVLFPGLVGRSTVCLRLLAVREAFGISKYIWKLSEHIDTYMCKTSNTLTHAFEGKPFKP